MITIILLIIFVNMTMIITRTVSAATILIILLTVAIMISTTGIISISITLSYSTMAFVNASAIIHYLHNDGYCSPPNPASRLILSFQFLLFTDFESDAKSDPDL